jgi:hypothetical protein
MATIPLVTTLAPTAFANNSDATALSVDFASDDDYRPYTISLQSNGSGVLAVQVQPLHVPNVDYFEFSSTVPTEFTCGYRTPIGVVGEITQVRVYVLSGLSPFLTIKVVERGAIG